MAELLKIFPDNPNPKLISKVVSCLNDGGIVIYPTDTIYGMGCDIHKTKTVEKIAQYKGINLQKANFSFICYDLSHISDYCKPLNNSTFRLMKKALPGPYTFILNANNKVPKLFQSKKKTVGIRVPDNLITRQIIKEFGNPLMSTSIHDDDQVIEFTTDPELIYEKYKNFADIIIDGGYGDNEPSTVLDCTQDEIVIIRLGKGKIIHDY
jgi:tRNA threonylcarbamoyl adenosine modification protein (Sua5/YciO/YrdC/YwlC family)